LTAQKRLCVISGAAIATLQETPISQTLCLRSPPRAAEFDQARLHSTSAAPFAGVFAQHGSHRHSQRGTASTKHDLQY